MAPLFPTGLGAYIILSLCGFAMSKATRPRTPLVTTTTALARAEARRAIVVSAAKVRVSIGFGFLLHGLTA